MEREACLRAGGSRGWMSQLAAARKPGPTQHWSSPIQALGPLGCAVSQVVKTTQLRGRTERTLLFVCYTQLITPTSADELPVVGGRCTGGAHRCKVKQGCREDRADVCILDSKVVRFGGCVQSEREKIILVTMGHSVTSASRKE